MAKDIVYIFTDNNVRSFTNPENLDGLLKLPNSFLNPELKKVKGVPRHFWKVEDGQIVPMTASEQLMRKADHAVRGVTNNVTLKPKRAYWKYALVAAVLFATAYFIRGYL